MGRDGHCVCGAARAALLAVLGLVVMSGGLRAQDAGKGLDGFWIRDKVNGQMAMQLGGEAAQQYYKAIGNGAFAMVVFDGDSEPWADGSFSAKGGTYQWLNDSTVMEGGAPLAAGVSEGVMTVRWDSNDGKRHRLVEESWVKSQPNSGMERLFATLTGKVDKKHRFTGVWKLKEQYVMQDNTQFYETVPEKYKVIGDDSYCGFYIQSNLGEIAFFRGWYGTFEHIAGNKVRENGGKSTNILWTGKDEYIFMYSPNKEVSPDNIIYEVWTRSELPEVIKTAFKALDLKK